MAPTAFEVSQGAASFEVCERRSEIPSLLSLPLSVCVCVYPLPSQSPVTQHLK